MLKKVSLQGRLLRVLCLALVLIAAVLVAVDFVAFKASIAQRVAQRSAAEGLGEALADVDEAVAAHIVRATELQFNRTRRAAGLPDMEDLAFQLTTPDGRLVYRSAGLSGPPVQATQAREPELQLQDRRYWPWLHATPRWQVLLLEPVVRDGVALRWLGEGLLPSMLIAIPLLMLPLWWAVRTGLAPLRRLVATLARRDAAELSPLQLDLRYAELQPIVSAMDGLLARARAHVEHERVVTHHTAHELRTPLAVVAAQAHALRTATDEEAAERAHQGLQRGIQRTSHLVEQLLTLAQLESPRTPRTATETDLVALCRQHVIDLTPLADARGMEVALVSPEHAPARVVVPALQSVVDNLLRNALLHCPAGAWVELRLARTPAGWQLDVVDNGPGIPTAERDRAFERFFRGQGAGPGSGLGLAIVNEAARVLGGSVHLADRAQGTGLQVTVTWPDSTPTTA